MASQKDFQDGVIANFSKLEVALEKVNVKIDVLNNKDITDLKIEMATLRTQVKIYAGIAAFVGMSIGVAISKFLIH